MFEKWIEILLNKAKFAFTSLTFMNQFQNDLYKRILGHNKIIGYEKGLPVYSLFMPAVMGDAHRKSLVSLALGNMQGKKIPMTVNFGVTDICDCNCEHCVFERVREQKPALTTEEVENTLNQCADLGVSVIAIVGGEPLLQKDFVQIVDRFDTDNNTLLLFSNGSQLEKKAPLLKKAGLNRVFVSLEYPDASRHDEITKHKGLFEKAIKGIKACQKEGMLVGASITIHEDLSIDDFRRFMDLAKNLGLKELFISKEINADNPNLSVCPPSDFLTEINKINNDKSIPFGIFYYQLFSSIQGFGGCSAGASRFYINPYGDITPCDTLKRSFGNIKTERLDDIWYRMSNTQGFGSVHGPCRFHLDFNENNNEEKA